MSLDVYLTGGPIECPDCNRCFTCDGKRIVNEELFSANITHNLGRMADEAGIYEHLWRPEEIGITQAKELIEPLKKGLDLMKSDPERFRKFNSPNGWGLYENFVPWIERYLEACEANPNAKVRASR